MPPFLAPLPPSPSNKAGWAYRSKLLRDSFSKHVCDVMYVGHIHHVFAKTVISNFGKHFNRRRQLSVESEHLWVHALVDNVAKLIVILLSSIELSYEHWSIINQ